MSHIYLCLFGEPSFRRFIDPSSCPSLLPRWFRQNVDSVRLEPSQGTYMYDNMTKVCLPSGAYTSVSEVVGPWEGVCVCVWGREHNTKITQVLIHRHSREILIIRKYMTYFVSKDNTCCGYSVSCFPFSFPPFKHFLCFTFLSSRKKVPGPGVIYTPQELKWDVGRVTNQKVPSLTGSIHATAGSSLCFSPSVSCSEI